MIRQSPGEGGTDFARSGGQRAVFGADEIKRAIAARALLAEPR